MRWCAASLARVEFNLGSRAKTFNVQLEAGRRVTLRHNTVVDFFKK
jgi:hypothetical protein